MYVLFILKFSQIKKHNKKMIYHLIDKNISHITTVITDSTRYFQKANLHLKDGISSIT